MTWFHKKLLRRNNGLVKPVLSSRSTLDILFTFFISLCTSGLTGSISIQRQCDNSSQDTVTMEGSAAASASTSSTLVFFVNGRRIVEPSPDPGQTLLTYLRNKLRYQNIIKVLRKIFHPRGA